MTTATDMLAKYLAAETAILDGQEVSFGNRRLKMVNLPEIQAGRREWEAKVNAEKAVTYRAPRIGGLTMSVASFNSSACGRDRRG